MAASPFRMRRLLHGLLIAATAGVCFVVALGFIGRFGAAFDSFSHFRLHAGVAALVLALILVSRRLWWLGAATAAASATALLSVLPYLLPTNAPPPIAGAPSYSLLQMNLLFRAEDRNAALRTIADTLPDVVTVQEMTSDWRQTLLPLEAAYPHQLHCDGADGFVGDSAILSRRPFVEGAEPVCDRRNSLAAARIDFNGVAVTVASHHQLWPWPAGQWRRLDRLREKLAALPAPLVLAGDFNAVPWSAFVQAYETILDAEAVRGIRGSWVPDFVPSGWARTVGLPIDNILVSDAVLVNAARTLPPTTSDHLPVLVTFTVETHGPAEPPVQIVERRAP